MIWLPASYYWIKGGLLPEATVGLGRPGKIAELASRAVEDGGAARRGYGGETGRGRYILF